jgi:uncharacterized protein (TIGR02217 family)
MAFHDIRFSTVISQGSRGGPGLFVNIARTDSGSDERVSRWPLPKRQYNASYGVRSQDDLYDTIEFFIARDGPTNGFRWKDWMDYTTGLRGVGAHASGNELIGTGDASNKVFQLIKSYEKGGTYEKQRPIEKPVSGTVKVAVTGEPIQIENTHFTVSHSTGLVTFVTAPPAGQSVTAGCEFDVPVQFGEEFSVGAMQAALDNFQVGSIDSIPLVEMNSGVSAPERYFHGDGSARTLASDVRYEWSWGMANVFIVTQATSVVMPDTLDLESGINYPYFRNDATSTHNILFRDVTDTTTLWTLAPGQGGLSMVYLASGIKTWAALYG